MILERHEKIPKKSPWKRSNLGCGTYWHRAEKIKFTQKYMKDLRSCDLAAQLAVLIWKSFV